MTLSSYIGSAVFSKTNYSSVILHTLESALLHNQLLSHWALEGLKNKIEKSIGLKGYYRDSNSFKMGEEKSLIVLFYISFLSKFWGFLTQSLNSTCSRLVSSLSNNSVDSSKSCRMTVLATILKISKSSN